VGASDGLESLRLGDHVGQREARKVLAHVISDVRPDREEHALALVVTRAVAVRLTKVARDNGTIDRRHDLRQRYGFSAAREHVAPTNTTFGAYEPDPLQTEQNLLEVGLGQTGAFGQITNGSGMGAIVAKRKAQ